MDADEQGWWEEARSDSRRSAILSQLFRSRISDQLAPIVGHQLLEVQYNCLECEVSDERDVSETDFYTGGEVELLFSGDVGKLFVTWDENAGWDLHFSVKVDSKSYWDNGALTPTDASSTPLWRRCIGGKVQRVSVLALDETPSAVVLTFADEQVVLGSACGGSHPIVFGDGDDIFLQCYDPVSDACSELIEIWSHE